MPSEGVLAETSLCQTCLHCQESEFICDAYPSGIPDDILINAIMHDKVLPDQEGTTTYEEAS